MRSAVAVRDDEELLAAPALPLSRQDVQLLFDDLAIDVPEDADSEALGACFADAVIRYENSVATVDGSEDGPATAEDRAMIWADCRMAAVARHFYDGEILMEEPAGKITIYHVDELPSLILADARKWQRRQMYRALRAPGRRAQGARRSMARARSVRRRRSGLVRGARSPGRLGDEPPPRRSRRVVS